MMSQVTPALGRVWSGGRRVERVAYVIGAVLLTCGVVHIGVLVATGGIWPGPLSYVVTGALNYVILVNNQVGRP